MKRLLIILLLGLAPSFFQAAFANPFGNAYVCVPKIAANRDILEFRIRDGGPCGEDEEWRKVVPKEDGITILFPSEGPPSPETKKDLEGYRGYYGIIR